MNVVALGEECERKTGMVNKRWQIFISEFNSGFQVLDMLEFKRKSQEKETVKSFLSIVQNRIFFGGDRMEKELGFQLEEVSNQFSEPRPCMEVISNRLKTSLSSMVTNYKEDFVPLIQSTSADIVTKSPMDPGSRSLVVASPQVPDSKTSEPKKVTEVNDLKLLLEVAPDDQSKINWFLYKKIMEDEAQPQPTLSTGKQTQSSEEIAAICKHKYSRKYFLIKLLNTIDNRGVIVELSEQNFIDISFVLNGVLTSVFFAKKLNGEDIYISLTALTRLSMRDRVTGRFYYMTKCFSGLNKQLEERMSIWEKLYGFLLNGAAYKTKLADKVVKLSKFYASNYINYTKTKLSEKLQGLEDLKNMLVSLEFKSELSLKILFFISQK